MLPPIGCLDGALFTFGKLHRRDRVAEKVGGGNPRVGDGRLWGRGTRRTGLAARHIACRIVPPQAPAVQEPTRWGLAAGTGAKLLTWPLIGFARGSSGDGSCTRLRCRMR